MASSPRKISFIDRKSSNVSTTSISSTKSSPRRRSSISSKFSLDTGQRIGKMMFSSESVELPSLSTGRKSSVTGGTTTRRSSLTGRGHVPPLSRKSSNSSLPRTGPPSPGRSFKSAIPESKSKQSSQCSGSALKIGFKQLLVTKRMARNLKLRTSQRIAEKRGRSYVTYIDRPRRKTMSFKPIIRLEPTYKLEPHETFALHHAAIMNILENIVEGTLKDCKYSPSICATLAQQLAGNIQSEVKDIGLDRYRLITIVHIGERTRQSMRIASKAIWDPNVDSYATYRFQNESMFCTATIYGIYLE